MVNPPSSPSDSPNSPHDPDPDLIEEYIDVQGVEFFVGEALIIICILIVIFLLI